MLREIALALAVGTTSAAEPRATDGFRAEHVEVGRHLAHIADWIAVLPGQSGADRDWTMARALTALRTHIVPHAEWEERTLYPLIDRQARTVDDNRFTAVMRREHVIIARSIGALAMDAEKKDGALFARHAERLLGLIEAHFECEEEVLLPILDRTLTRAEFDAAIRAGGEAH